MSFLFIKKITIHPVDSLYITSKSVITNLFYILHDVFHEETTRFVTPNIYNFIPIRIITIFFFSSFARYCRKIMYFKFYPFYPFQLYNRPLIF